MRSGEFLTVDIDVRVMLKDGPDEFNSRENR